MSRVIRRVSLTLRGSISLMLALLVFAHATSGNPCVNCGGAGGCPAGHCADCRYDARLSGADQSLVAPLRVGHAVSNVPQPDSDNPQVGKPRDQPFTSVGREFTSYVSIRPKFAWHLRLDSELTSAPLYLLLRQLRL
jgi:hypothetical protein